MPEAREATWRKVLKIFHDEHEVSYADRLTPTQVLIIDIIAKRRYPRTQLILPTQYGKSLSVALGVLLRVAHFPEKWAIVAPTEDKARIIMDYIIDHIFDDPLFAERLEYYGSKERLKSEKSKTRITFRGAGEVRVYSGSADNTKKVKKALIGFGAPNVVLDESAMIPDELYATVKRMLGGSKDNFLLEIGNPAFRNHFHRTWFGDRYVKIYKDCWMALEEGRYTQDYLNEMQEEAGFEWMYLCQFPEANEVLPSGYRRLLLDEAIDNAFIDPPMPEIAEGDKPLLGIDVGATGTGQTKFVIRFPKSNFSMVARSDGGEDLDDVADIAVSLIKQWGIEDYRTMPDAGGVGHGLAGILKARGYLVKPILFGEKAPEKAFMNMRAWMYWQARKWIKGGGRLLRDPGFLELKLINYKQNASLKLQVEPKEDMIRRKRQEGEAVESPDTADAFVLTFADTGTIVDEDDIDFD